MNGATNVDVIRDALTIRSALRPGDLGRLIEQRYDLTL
jgi:hypothetical protein